MAASARRPRQLRRSSIRPSHSAGRLRSLLFDDDAAVRDAAFTALSALSAADPLAVADAGLGAAQEDVRRRGLQTVIAVARQQPPQSADDPAWPLHAAKTLGVKPDLVPQYQRADI